MNKTVFFYNNLELNIRPDHFIRPFINIVPISNFKIHINRGADHTNIRKNHDSSGRGHRKQTLLSYIKVRICCYEQTFYETLRWNPCGEQLSPSPQEPDLLHGSQDRYRTRLLNLMGVQEILSICIQKFIAQSSVRIPGHIIVLFKTQGVIIGRYSNTKLLSHVEND